MQIQNAVLGAQLRAEQSLPPVEGPTPGAAYKWLSAEQPNRFHGWSVIAPVPLDSPFITPARQVLAALRSQHAPGEWSVHPLSSLHMTVFSGTEQAQLADGSGPKWVHDMANPVAVWREALARLEAAPLPHLGGPLEVQVVGFEDLSQGASATVECTTAEQQAKVRDFRDAVAEAIQWHRVDHDRYRFHITFSYRLNRVPSKTAAQLTQLGQEYCQVLQAAGPIQLDAPVFTVFESMVSFPGILQFD